MHAALNFKKESSEFAALNFKWLSSEYAGIEFPAGLPGGLLFIFQFVS